MKGPLLAVLGALLLCLATPALADTLVEYRGPHPVDPALGAGMCYIEGPHVHGYQPHQEVLYVHDDGGWVFVGDPVEFERDSPRYPYYGHHPVFWSDVDGRSHEHYCYITGPHYHWYEPPPAMAFRKKGGAYWYVGQHPSWYKARSHKRLDSHYSTVQVVHPVVEEAPPPGFIGVVIGGPSLQVGISLPFGTVHTSHAYPVEHRVIEHHVIEHRDVEYHRHKHPGPPRHAPARGHDKHRGKDKKWR